jgi:hypothetical protein
VDSEEEEVDSVGIETTPETQATPLSSWAKMIRMPRRVPLELLQERRFFFDDVLKTLSFTIYHLLFLF